MNVQAAVRKAKEAARQYAGASTGVRVEEVEQASESVWYITLSWLEVDEAKQIREGADPMLRLRAIVSPVPPFERVYHVFQIQGDDPVKMKRAPEP